MDGNEKKSPEVLLRDKLIEAEATGKAVSSQGRDAVQSGQFISDFARATLEIAKSAPELLDIEAQIGLWDEINSHAMAGLSGLEDANRYMALASGTASTATVSVFSASASADAVIPYFQAEMQEPAKKAVENYNLVISRYKFKESVLELLKEYEFDKAPRRKKSPLELYLTAYQAFELPVSDTNPVSTSLIPMRECINSFIAELLRRRPKQVKSGNNYEKIMSIGKQLRKDGLSDDVIREWATDWKNLVDRLSQAKENELAREEWGNLLQEGTLYLNSILNGLDPTKVKLKAPKDKHGN